MEYVRSLLHKLVFSLIQNKDTRDAGLHYISQLLKLNYKRTQYSADERNLARDGYMLNVMAVMQQMSVRIKLQLVDPLYPFHPKSLIYIKEDTKLRFESVDFEKFMEKSSKIFFVRHILFDFN